MATAAVRSSEVAGFARFGGASADSAALQKILAHAGATDPTTKKPLGEALVFGIGGGIGAGISNCPSVRKWHTGGGFAPVAWNGFTYDAGWHRAACARLGVPLNVLEASSPKAGTKKLADELAAGRPALVQCVRGLPYTALCVDAAWIGSNGAVVVHELDLDAGVAHVSDLGADSFEIALADLEEARGMVCTHKNRLLTVGAKGPIRLDAKTLAAAALAGARACALGQEKPRIRTYSLEGLQEFARTMADPKRKDGWPKVFADGSLYDALVDQYEVVEVLGAGGLLRPLYADFLDEAARLTKRPALAACAERWRALAKGWSAYADAALPDSVKPLAQAKRHLSDWRRAFRDEGRRGLAKMKKARAELTKLRHATKAKFPLDAIGRQALLDDLGERLRELAAGEAAAFAALSAAVK